MLRRTILVPLITSAAAMPAIAAPAAAAPSGGTPLTVTVTGGNLDITVPPGPVSLGAVAPSINPQTVSSQLGDVTVIDGRGGTTGWVATASAVDFTGPQNISVSAPGSSSYTTPSATVTGTATVTQSNLSPLYPPGPVQTATGVSGINTATWDPLIALTIPANTLSGTYNSVLTHSVS